MRHARPVLDLGVRDGEHGTAARGSTPGAATPIGPVRSRRPHLDPNGSLRVTTTSTDRISTPWVLGGIAAVGAWVIGLAICVVPALAGQLAASNGSLTVLGAVLLGVDVFVLGHGGSLVITGGALPGVVSLSPLGLTLLLLAVVASAMRRMARALSLVTAEGGLRAGAVRDALVTLAAFVVVYAAGGGLVAAVGRSATVHPVASSAVVGAALVAMVGGLAGLLLGLRSSGRRLGVPVRVLDLLPSPYEAVARAVAIALVALLAAGLLTALGAIALAAPRVLALDRQLEAGIVGGIVLALVQLALLPLFAVWCLAVLLGGTFSVGTGTGVSLGGAESGLMPALPLLGAMPQPGESPWYVWLLLVLPVVAVGLGAVRLARDLSGRDPRSRIIAWVAYVVALAVVLLLVLGLSGGGIGRGRLEALGPDLGSVLLPMLGIVGLTTLVVAILLDTPLTRWARERWDALRVRVERSESLEDRAGAPSAAQEAAGSSAEGHATASDSDEDDDASSRSSTGRADDGHLPAP